jgi:hypothetical protein
MTKITIHNTIKLLSTIMVSRQNILAYMYRIVTMRFMLLSFNRTTDRAEQHHHGSEQHG